MVNESLGVYVSIISKARPKNVPKMAELVGDATWFVGEGEADVYREAGAPAVVESGGLCRSRNAGFGRAFELGLPCVQLSDDLRKLQFAMRIGNKTTGVDAGFEEAVSAILEACRTSGAKLGGVAPTSNAFYYNTNRPVHHQAFIVGDFVVGLPCELRWDERMKLKEDYDLTLAHIHTYGCVARCNFVLATFLHRNNPGGAVDFRTPEREQEAIEFLKNKWPGMIRDNPRRPNEILLVLK